MKIHLCFMNLEVDLFLRFLYPHIDPLLAVDVKLLISLWKKWHVSQLNTNL